MAPKLSRERVPGESAIISREETIVGKKKEAVMGGILVGLMAVGVLFF